MNPRELSFKALNEVLIKHKNFTNVLSSLRARYELSPKDWRLFYTLTKGTIKQKIYIDFIIKSLMHHKEFAHIPPEMKNLLRLGLFQIIFLDNVPDYAAVNEVMKICNQLYNKKLCALLNAILREFIRAGDTIQVSRDNPAHRISIQYSFPRYMIETWLVNYGEENTIKMCEYFNAPPTLHIRFDPNKISFKDITEHLEQKGIRFEPGKFNPLVLHIFGKFDFINDPLFLSGGYYIQDESSTLPVLLLDVCEEDLVLDMCAAPGGKATFIASLMHNKGKIVANDIDSKRAERLLSNIKQMGYTNIEVLTQDASQLETTHKFDKILLDAPCTGWGSMQKKPEIRLQSQRKLKNLLPLQEKLLNKAADLLKDGGILVYSTCTLTHEENEDQIGKFLTSHPEFYVENPIDFIDRNLIIGNYLNTYPFKHDIDGSFAARLRKAEICD
jgi:16S rRNA (cytosine967-C5)-methyltransferase